MFLHGYVKCSILDDDDDLQLTIFACYLWEMALNVGTDELFDYM